MSAGLDASIQTLNRACGQAVVNLANAIDAVVGINTMLQNAERGFAVVTNQDSSTTDPLTQGDSGMSTDDAAALRNAFFALNLWAQVGFGAIAQPGAEASNFWFDAQKLMGANPL